MRFGCDASLSFVPWICVSGLRPMQFGCGESLDFDSWICVWVLRFVWRAYELVEIFVMRSSVLFRDPESLTWNFQWKSVLWAFGLYSVHWDLVSVFCVFRYLFCRQEPWNMKWDNFFVHIITLWECDLCHWYALSAHKLTAGSWDWTPSPFRAFIPHHWSVVAPWAVSTMRYSMAHKDEQHTVGFNKSSILLFFFNSYWLPPKTVIKIF